MDYIVSKNFDVTINDLTINFEFYTMSYIIETLKALKMDYFTINTKNDYRKELKDKAFNKDREEKYHFLSFIRFFEDGDIPYGIVGGKTTYLYPDVHPGNTTNKEKRYSRLFLDQSPKRKWHDNVLIINHKEKLEKNDDERQALFIECFIQRRFNLFDS